MTAATRVMLVDDHPMWIEALGADRDRYENKLAGVTGKADQFGLGYIYSLSKRTSVYGTYAYLKNKNGASLYTLGSGGLKDNGSQQGMQVGITHAF